MPQFTEINATSAIPVAGTILHLEPVQLNGPQAIYAGEVRIGGTAPTTPVVAALEPTAVISLRKPSKTSRVSKAQVTIILPQPGVLPDGTPSRVKDREARVDFTLTTSERATDDERKQALDFVLEMLYTGYLREVLVNNKTIY